MTYNPNRRTVLKAVGSASALVVAGGIGTSSARKGAGAEKNIVETVIDRNSDGPFAGAFDTLIAAVKEAELVDALSGNRQLTVFGPTDEAFDGVLDIVPGDVGGFDNDALRSILTYHVTPAGGTRSPSLMRRASPH